MYILSPQIRILQSIFQVRNSTTKLRISLSILSHPSPTRPVASQQVA